MKLLDHYLKDQLNIRIAKLAYPAVLEMMLHMAVGIADVAMVGRLGAEPLAAISLGSQIFFSVIFIFNAIGIGAAAIVARSVGAGKFSEANFITAQALLMAGAIGLFTGTIAYFSAPKFFTFFAVTPNVIQMGTDYLQIVALPSGIFLVSLVAESIVRGSGNTKIPLLVAVIANTTNIILNYILIYGKFGFPQLGVQGAAYATSISLTLACAVMLTILCKGWINIQLQLADFRQFDVLAMKRILRLSLPAGAEELLRSSSNITSIYFISSLGAITYAAHQVALTVESLSFMPGFGLAMASSSLVGRSLGAKKIKQAVEVGWRAAGMAIVAMSFMSALFYFGSMFLVKLFTTDPDVLPIASMAVTIAAFEQPTIAVYLVFLGVLRGAGDTKWPFYLALIGNWLIRIPLFYLAIFHWGWGIREIWYITVLQWLIMASLAFWRFLQGDWQHKEV